MLIDSKINVMKISSPAQYTSLVHHGALSVGYSPKNRAGVDSRRVYGKILSL
ncbi:MAG: hypothetical protein UY92_C0001G0093 [Candidatus Magasanikbacteria bacterium GW2011_GWA2_56_11]|uniref:Uncharacterized protein n=1 Tax=Candidatus Magasanikbacteria bacterium GW2011_GWA2_56_11 TaxID=1619044 RepID=A0A0G2BBY9_9BACT|nr:MAG: hypothetical protein UY92_C0001G0093 [Candidatus Magasanikbacteria bacterium GW2011_GWA2_56_11]